MDNRINKLKNIVTLLAVIFVLGLAMIATMIPAHNFFTVCTLAVQVIVITYFTVLSRSLIRDNADHERADEERKLREKQQLRQEQQFREREQLPER